MKKLLVKDPHMRLTAAQALCTQFFSVLISYANTATSVAKSYSCARQDSFIEFVLEITMKNTHVSIQTFLCCVSALKRN